MLLGKSIGRLIFESYKPKTLEEAREYIDFVLSERSIIPQTIEDDDSEALESEITQPSLKKDYDFLTNQEKGSRSSRFENYLRMEKEKRKGTM